MALQQVKYNTTQIYHIVNVILCYYKHKWKKKIKY